MRLLAILLSALSLAGLTACSDSRAPTIKNESTYSAIARGKIDVEGGLLNIEVPEATVFAEIAVKPGAAVKAGDVMARLNADQEGLALELATAEMAHAQLDLDALNMRVKSSGLLAERWQSAAKEGAAEQLQADEAQQNLQQLHAEIASAKSTLELANIKRKQAQHALALRTMHAPQDAVVVKVSAQAGGSANSSAPAFVLLPNKPLIIRAEINESYISQIHEGAKASVSFEAAPQNAQIEAHVVYVGSLLEAGHWGEEQQQTSRVVECILEMDQAQHYLVGQNVMVKFHAEH
jgi:multidrug resistance efflux pump